MNEEGDYLGDDGDEDSHDTRVIAQSTWDDIVGDTKEDDITEEMRENLQYGGEFDAKGNHIPESGYTSKRLSEYEQGISISDEVWGALEEKGGVRLDPYLINNSGDDV